MIENMLHRLGTSAQTLCMCVPRRRLPCRLPWPQRLHQPSSPRRQRLGLKQASRRRLGTGIQRCRSCWPISANQRPPTRRPSNHVCKWAKSMCLFRPEPETNSSFFPPLLPPPPPLSFMQRRRFSPSNNRCTLLVLARVVMPRHSSRVGRISSKRSATLANGRRSSSNSSTTLAMEWGWGWGLGHPLDFRDNSQRPMRGVHE